MQLLSRNLLRKGFQLNIGLARLTSTAAQKPQILIPADIPPEGPERDLVNFPRPVRAEFAGRVRLGIFPQEWFDFFYKKTGVTGPWVFGAGLVTFLCSKEYYIMDHEFYAKLPMVFITIGFIKIYGPTLKELFVKKAKEHDGNLEGIRTSAIDALQKSIAGEKQAQKCAEGQKLLFDAKRENVALQVEAAYRQRLDTVYKEVKRRLDYQLELQNAENRLKEKYMVDWIIDSVRKAITPQQEKEALQQCMAALSKIASRAT